MSGLRYNQGKSELSMILEARHALSGCAKVLEFGKAKYDRGNWRKGLSHTQICDSMLRHLSAYLSGEDNDPESGLPHVDHICTNALFLAEMVRTHPEKDDRSFIQHEGKDELSNSFVIDTASGESITYPVPPCSGHAYNEEY